MPNRIREMRLLKRMTLEQLGDRVGLSYSQVAKIEKGDRGLTLDWLQRFARALECRAASLLPPDPVDEFLDQPAGKDRPDLGFQWAERAGLHVTQWPVPLRGEGSGYSPHGCAWFGLEFLAKFDIDPKLCEVVEVRDSSMQESLPYGSVALIDCRRREFRDGALYAVERNREPIIRRARFAESGWILIADNTNLPPIRVGGEYRTVGRVVWTARMLEAVPA